MRGRNPFDELERFFERMSQQFGESWGGNFEMTGGMGSSMSVDVADQADEIVVTADLPGFSKEDIDVRLSDTTLRIAARKEEATEAGGDQENYIRQERTRRSMSRAITLPEPVDEEGVSAKYTNGVLTVTLPKMHATGESRSISIE
jgi:HSP20 family protein